MPQVSQLPLSFARPKKKKAGLHVEEYRGLVDRLRTDAARVAEHFKLPPYELDADRPDARDRYGVCFDDGRIKVRLVNVRTGHVLRYSALIDTVVHELAHLKHMNHGPRWEALYDQMLAWCRAEGIYSPQPRRRPPSIVSENPISRQPAQLRPTRCSGPWLAPLRLAEKLNADHEAPVGGTEAVIECGTSSQFDSQLRFVLACSFDSPRDHAF